MCGERAHVARTWQLARNAARWREAQGWRQTRVWWTIHDARTSAGTGLDCAWGVAYRA